MRTLKRCIENSVFSNPKSWARSVVGRLWSYRLMQAYTVLFGVILAAVVFFAWKKADMPLAAYPAILIFVVVTVVQLPLSYLRALRIYVLESEPTTSLHSTPR